MGAGTALHLACAKGHAEEVNILVERKCELNIFDNRKRTPLIKAVQCQQGECAHILLDCGANPNVSDNGNTALHYAACCQSLITVAQLLSHNTDIEVKNKEDLTLLLLSISEKNNQMVEYLLTQGANAHALDKCKRTALMTAVDKFALDIIIIESLLQGMGILKAL